MTSKVNDTSIDNVLSGRCNRPLTESMKRTVKLNSPSELLNNAIVTLDRVVTDWRTNPAPHSVIYLRRAAALGGLFFADGDVYQAVIRDNPGVGGEFRNQQGVWIHESEIGRPYNGYEKIPFTDEQQESYLTQPDQCPYDCGSNSSMLVTVSIILSSYAIVRRCLYCEGEWQENLQVMNIS